MTADGGTGIPPRDRISPAGLGAVFILGATAWTLIGYGIYQAAEALT